jgi:hypothetical protein
MALNVLKALVLLAFSLGAQAAVYVCEEGGMKVFRDRPCAAGDDPLAGVPRTSTFPVLPQPATMSIPIFSQVLVLTLPKGWKPGFQDVKRMSYLAEFIPAEQTVQAWKEMITVQGARGQANNPAAAPKAYLDGISLRMRKFCGPDAVTQDLGATRVDAYQAHAAIMGCARAPEAQRSGLAKGEGEVAYFVAIKGENELYIIQRAIRGAAFDSSKPPISAATLDQLWAPLQPIKVCRSSESRNDCLARKPR